ncbi:TetR/AcrR family transcriptional regulator [Thaumasiovibrio subtropicus]|uniref:TetR/AcrR family transcriptional regulator n=1 Tax=Thaumasiovibrio subtropicus TaxID=1891207 RepID=UPI000B3594E6|nr:TetR/AcrR family transcriptional regulator [Thaumasiovibrio subtropicus]
MAGRQDTKTKILDTAELLFAEHGFNETSLRTITSRAGVNLASVNYHYGDKKSLVRAVLSRYLEAFMPQLRAELDVLMTRDEFTMEEVFLCLKAPLLSLNAFRRNGAAIFMQLLGRGYTDVQGHLRWFIVTRYQDVLSLFTTAVCRANPALDPETLFWRLHFTLGACVFTMASSKALSEIAASDFGRSAETEDIFDRLVPYLAAGVGAEVDQELAVINQRTINAG